MAYDNAYSVCYFVLRLHSLQFMVAYCLARCGLLCIQYVIICLASKTSKNLHARTVFWVFSTQHCWCYIIIVKLMILK